MDHGVETVTWRPPKGYDLALEVMSISELRRRGTPEHFRAPQRAEFFLLIGVTDGETHHVIDFEAHEAPAGTWLLVRPGQMQRFDFRRFWEGLLVIFRPEFLLPGGDPLLSSVRALTDRLEDLPGRTLLSAGDHAVCCAGVSQMRRDAASGAPARDRDALMLFQLYALLLRLEMAHGVRDERGKPSDYARRVAALRRLVDAHFLRRRDVAYYAKALGCGEKALARATLAVTGLRPKALIVQRTVLEAKRLLVHTGLSVEGVSEALGFFEASNFVKFFRREVGCTPVRFRERAAGS